MEFIVVDFGIINKLSCGLVIFLCIPGNFSFPVNFSVYIYGDELDEVTYLEK